jgi:ABC-2 type transport system ATP-binding protein
VLENATPELLAEIQRAIQSSGGSARLVRQGQPRTTLERLFLEATGEVKAKS